MIKLEDFKKLKQLDRIEFMLRRKGLDEQEENWKINWIQFAFIIFGLVGFLILISIGFMNYGATEGTIKMLSASSKILIVSIYVIILCVIWNFIFTMIFLKHKREMEEEFFTKEVKPKQKK